MQWLTDLLKEIPLSAVSAERRTIAEDRARAIEEENTKLRQLLNAANTENERLREEVERLTPPAEEHVKHRGVLWLKVSGAFEECPYCPKCRVPMSAFPPMGSGLLWICWQCDLQINHCKPPAA